MGSGGGGGVDEIFTTEEATGAVSSSWARAAQTWQLGEDKQGLQACWYAGVGWLLGLTARGSAPSSSGLGKRHRVRGVGLGLG
jgi:hypothetical protein